MGYTIFRHTQIVTWGDMAMAQNDGALSHLVSAFFKGCPATMKFPMWYCGWLRHPAPVGKYIGNYETSANSEILTG